MNEYGIKNPTDYIYNGIWTSQVDAEPSTGLEIFEAVTNDPYRNLQPEGKFNLSIELLAQNTTAVFINLNDTNLKWEHGRCATYKAPEIKVLLDS